MWYLSYENSGNGLLPKTELMKGLLDIDYATYIRRPPLPWFFALYFSNPYLKIIDLSKMFVADAPMKKNPKV